MAYRGAEPDTLERGWRRWRLITQLAEGEIGRTTLAKQYGVSPQAITRFARRHIADIDAAQQTIEDEMSTLWVSKRYNRIAEYQQIVEDVTTRLDRAADISDKDMRDLLKIKANVLHTVADELGQLPPRREVAGDGVVVVNQIIGVIEEPDLV
jgi:hypothetical protein